VRRPISGHRGIGGGQLLVLLTEMKRYLLDTKRVGTSKETRVNDDENLSFFL
jgi:hypothetical protein